MVRGHGEGGVKADLFGGGGWGKMTPKMAPGWGIMDT